jgi:type IV pilus modification protein PilV
MILGSRRREQRRKRNQRGFGLIELLVAMLVLTVGLLGGMVILAMAVASNAQAKFDTGAVSLAQSTMDKILALSATAANPTTSVTDCNGTIHTVNSGITGNAPTGAPTITINGISNGTQAIDFSAAPVANYSMQYTMCAAGGAGYVGQPQVYDVRWNISPGPTPSTQLVLVEAKNMSEVGNGGSQSRYFAVPITLRALRGD